MIDFLDVNIGLGLDNSISTQLYEKETNAYMYVHEKSNHPRATKENIAYGLALRSKRICSNEEDYEQSKQKIEQRLLLRGYDQNVIKDKISKVDTRKREDLLSSSSLPKKNSKEGLVPLILPFSRALPNVKKILNQDKQILKNHSEIADIIVGKSFLSFKR